MHIEELHPRQVNVYHSEITLEQNFKKTFFVITEENIPSTTFKSYEIEMPDFVKQRIHLTDTMKNFYWYCLN